MTRCPVCQARFRGAAVCSRCGADLTRLMQIAAGAWRLREEARGAIVTGDFGRAADLAGHAQEMRATAGGKMLLRLAEWLSHRPRVSNGE